MDTIRRALDAFRANDVAALLELLDPEVEWVPSTHVLLRGPSIYRGHAGVTEWLRLLGDATEEWRPNPREFRVLGTQVVVLGSIHGRTKERRSLQFELAWVCSIVNGRLVSMHAYFETPPPV